MSNRKWKRTRHMLRSTQKRIDAEKRQGARAPLWRRMLDPLFPGLVETWWRQWEQEHRRKLKKAMKKVSHGVQT